MDLMPAYGAVCNKVRHIEHLATDFKALQQYFVLNRSGRGQRWKNWQWLQSVITGGGGQKSPSNYFLNYVSLFASQFFGFF